MSTVGSTEIQKLLQIAIRESQIGNVRRAYAVRMRRMPPRIVIELQRMPADLTLKQSRTSAANAAAREMLARRTLRYRDMTKSGHGVRAIRDGIKLLEEKGWVERRGAGRGAHWLK